MSVIKLTGFTGEQPRIIPRMLSDNAAQAAYNVRLDDGGLTPSRISVQQVTLQDRQAKTIYRHQGQWLSWPFEVNACPGPVASERLYYTGDGAPKLRVNNQVYRLAIGKPGVALNCRIENDSRAGQQRDVITRYYAYTFVSDFGEESEPSPVGSSINWQDGQTVRLSGFLEPPANRNITKQRIYRTQTGASSGTYLYFIAERTVSTNDFIDDIPNDNFNEALPSARWNPPPDGLKGLTAMPNGMMAAFDQRQLYFCEPYRPHAWPENYILTTDSDIVALGAIGSVLIILTKGQPYICSGSHPEAMQMVKLESNYPCINSRAVVDLGFCIVYPSHEGLIAVGADGNVRLISANLFNRDAWLSLSPQTMVAAQMSGRYVAFYDTVNEQGKQSGALFVDAGETPFLIRSGEKAQAAFYEVGTGALHYVRPDGNDVYRLDSPEGDRNTLYWKSKQFYLPHPDNFGVILVESDRMLSGDEIRINEEAIQQAKDRNAQKLKDGPVFGEINAYEINAVPLGGDILEPIPRTNGTVSVGIIADGKKVAQITNTNEPCRLPSGFLARKWEIEVASDVAISTITMAKTIDELKVTA